MATAVVAAVATGLGVSTAVATALVQVGAGILLSAVRSAFVKKPSFGAGRDQEVELAKPQSLPPKRFPYGKDHFVTGSPAPAWVTKNGNLYCCHLLSSRPAGSISQLSFDRRFVEPVGDIFDFTGDGADVDHPKLGGHVRCWLGLGTQSGPPDAIMAEMGDATSTADSKFWTTDKWTGPSVLWSVLKKGDPASFRERWPSAPPEVGAIGDWSYVWDPRDPTQDADDPATWEVSNNAWLCILDALRFNPLARWPLAQINIDSFKAAADDADATRARLGGGTEPRWRIGGTAVFGGSVVLLDVIEPMVRATGGDILIDGTGLTAIPGKAQTPLMTVDGWIAGTSLEFRARRKSREVPKAFQAKWPQPEAKWELQTMQPITVPGQTWSGGDDRLEALDLDFVPFSGQVMHLQQIAARKAALGRGLSMTVGPEVFAEGAQAGDWITLDLGSEYAARNGTFQLSQVGYAEWLNSEDQVPFIQRIDVTETAASVYAWDPATDEFDVYVPSDVPEYNIGLEPPQSVYLTLDTDYGARAIVVDIVPSANYGSAGWASYFRVESRIGDGDWIFAGTASTIFRAGTEQSVSDTRLRIPDVAPETTYQIRVRGETNDGAVSEWVEETITTSGFAVTINGGDY